MMDRPTNQPAPPARSARLWRKARPWLIGAAALLFATVILRALRHVLDAVTYADIVAAIRDTPWGRLVAASIATALSFVALSGYDSSALRYVGAPVKRTSVLFISFIAYALGNTIGLGVLTGAAVRMRL